MGVVATSELEDHVGALPGNLAQAAEALVTALDTLLAVTPEDLDGFQTDALAGVLRRTADRALAGVARCLPALEADGLWTLGPHRSFAQWVARRFGTSVAQARRDVRLGRVLRDVMPLTAAAARDGAIGVETAHVLASVATTPARCEVLADPDHGCGESFLLGQAVTLPLDDLRTVTRAWAEHADPEADERGYREADEREFLELARLPFGYRVSGQLTVEHGQAVKAALAAVMPVPARTDARSTAQRRAQGLADLARVVLDRGLGGSTHAARPHLTVLVDHATLSDLVARIPARTRAAVAAGASGEAAPPPHARPATTTLAPEHLTRGAAFEDGTRVPRHVLDRLACDGELNRILFTPTGEVLEAGRTQRLFTGAKRAAIVARDRHCTYPGCTAPPSIGEGHHVDHWTRDHGATDVDVGVLLCYHHHHLVHARDVSIRRAAGTWEFTDRWGTVIRE